MTRWSKVQVVAGFEFTSTVKRVGYLITTFGMPLFLVAYAGVISGIGYFVHQKETEVKIYGVVDPGAVLDLESDVSRSAIDIPPEVRQALDAAGERSPMGGAFAFWSNFVFRPYPDMQAARTALVGAEVKGVYLIPEDFLETGHVEGYARENIDFGGSDSRGALEKLLLDRLLEEVADEQVAARVRDPIASHKNWTVTNEGTVEERNIATVIARLIVPAVFTILMFISLMMSAGYLMQGTAVEKENKLGEVLMSSANPDEILAGKLLGLAAAALLQILVWFGLVIFGAVTLAASLELVGLDVPWFGMLVALPYFLVGYLFLGSLMLGSGSLGSNQRESQQFSMVWTIVSVTPLVFLQILIFEPHGMLARVFTWIPFTSAVTVVLRTTIEPEGIAWWEIVGGLVMMIVATWMAIRIGARLFRIGLLLSSRPKLREVLRQARLSG